MMFKRKPKPQEQKMTKDKDAGATDNIASLKDDAKVAQAAVDELSDSIDELMKTRTAHRNKLRAITNKIVTIQLREEAK